MKPTIFSTCLWLIVTIFIASPAARARGDGSIHKSVDGWLIRRDGTYAGQKCRIKKGYNVLFYNVQGIVKITARGFWRDHENYDCVATYPDKVFYSD